MTKHIIETVTFKLAENVSHAAFLDTLPAVNTFIQSLDGFISRRLSQAEDGEWLDVIEWTSMEDAKSASDAFVKHEGCGPFMAAMDTTSIHMTHRSLQLSLG